MSDPANFTLSFHIRLNAAGINRMELTACPACGARVTSRMEYRHDPREPFDVYRFGCFRRTNPDPTIDPGATIVFQEGVFSPETITFKWDSICPTLRPGKET